MCRVLTTELPGKTLGVHVNFLNALKLPLTVRLLLCVICVSFSSKSALFALDSVGVQGSYF